MPLREAILALLNRVFHLRGMELRALTPPLEKSTMAAGLARVRQWVPEVATVVDIGAAMGKWTRLALPHFPRADFLLLEPLAERRAVLQALSREHPRVRHIPAAAGAAAGEVTFHIAADLDGSGISTSGQGVARQVPLTTVDAELAATAPGPVLLKLDTHGFELPILQGAEATLARTQALIIEAYNFTLAEGSPRFFELCAWLQARGFRCADLLDPLRRSTDGVLWQMDLVFLRHDHPVFARGHF